MSRFKFEYKITAAYLIIGGLWILFSDKLLFLFFQESKALTEMQTYKGWFYVIITGILLYFFLKKHLVKIRLAEQKAVENDRLKTSFIQNISHEIRTPMNGIIGFAGLLNSEELSNHQKSQYLDIIMKSTDQLLRIVNDVMDISIIESGNNKLYENQIHLNHFLDEIYAQYLPKIKTDISFSLNKVLQDTDCIIMTDEVKVRQIIHNLLNNAIRFTEKGHINFGYIVLKNEIEFYVEDSGVGMDRKVHDNIFERFFQADPGSRKLYEGIGLGLSICKGNVDILNGKIWVKSELNIGSSFYFTIPYKPIIITEGKVVGEEIIAKKNYMTILVAEDEETNYEYIKEIFENTNINIHHALNGKEAIDICRKHKNIDLILMDLKMPLMNGFEATRQIRSILPDIPIIAQSAFSLPEEKEMAFIAGCNKFISKPFKKKELLDILNDYSYPA